MQRAAASSPSASVPQDSSPPSAKRQKTTHSSPSTPATPFSDQAAIQAALEAEGAQREAAIARTAAERGETKWVLSFVETQKGREKSQRMKVVRAGYEDIDRGEGKVGGKENGAPQYMVQGRKSFGNFNRELEQQNRDADNSFSSSDEVDEAQNNYHEPGASELIHPQLQQKADRAKAQRKAEMSKGTHLAEDRRLKEVKLNKLTSISGTDGGKSRNANANIECHACGEKGHKKADCPNRGFKRKGDFDGLKPVKKKKNTPEPLDY
ncbi:MAG: hypothetical protein Q9195_002102 [Heterodermia aff. obscurata]